MTKPIFRQVVLALGTNIGNKAENLQNTVDALSLLPNVKILKASNVYTTSPVGYANQDDFLNAVLLIQTTNSPEMLLGMCLGIEAVSGRRRLFQNGPRVIDIDLIAYEGKVCNTAELILPHTRFKERAFVCYPLADLFPGMSCLGIPFSLSEFPGQKITGTSIQLNIY